MKKLIKIKKTIYKKEITEYTENTILKIKDSVQKFKFLNSKSRIQNLEFKISNSKSQIQIPKFKFKSKNSNQKLNLKIRKI